MAGNQTDKGSSRIAIDFIDPLFAVVMHISFVEVMERPWFAPASANFQPSFAFDIGILLLGYSTVVLNWVGYHLSIRDKPIRIETFPGLLRFISDIALLACYWLLLVKFENLWFVLLMLAMVYWVFVVWDQLKWWEYKDSDTPPTRRRRGISTFWAILFTLLFGLYWVLGVGDETRGTGDWAFLVVAHFATILYRVHKNFPCPGKLLDVLAFHWPQKEARI